MCSGCFQPEIFPEQTFNFVLFSSKSSYTNWNIPEGDDFGRLRVLAVWEPPPDLYHLTEVHN